MEPIEIRERENRPGRVRVMLNTGPGKTEQAHKKECDMNFILRNYQKTGIIRHAKEYTGRYDDVPAVDFQQAMETVAAANSMFEELPSSLRKRFKNDPAEFLAFAQNPDNRDEMAKLGMLKGNDGLDEAGNPVDSPTPSPAPSAPEPEPADPPAE